MANEPKDWSVYHFAQSNPEGPGQGDVPALLRRVADSIEALGEDAEVNDICFHTEITALGEENELKMVVYYFRNGDLSPGS